jgi:hypothetical protein
MQQDHWNSDKQDTVVQQKSGCFVTTAAVENLGKPDDCYELTTLRNYRDMWLRFQPGGEELVKRYYDAAPKIVERINASADRDAVYAALWKDCVSPCVRHIEAGEYEKCRDKYVEAMISLEKTYIEEGAE